MPPLFVFLVSGRPEGGVPHGTDNTFAACAWLRVAELVRIFHKNRKKTGAVVTDTTVLRFIHFASHNSTVGIYEHDFATMANRVRDPLAKNPDNNWRTLDANCCPGSLPGGHVLGLPSWQSRAHRFLPWNCGKQNG